HRPLTATIFPYTTLFRSLSRIPNIMQLRSDVNSSHFTGLRILHQLHNKLGSESSTGFIDVKYFIQEFEDIYSSKEDCEQHLDVLDRKSTRLNSSHVKISY